MSQSALARYPLFHTTDPMQVERGLIQTYGTRHFDLPSGSDNFEAAANKLQLPRVGISYCQYKKPVRLEFPEAAYVRQQFVIRGSGASIINGNHTSIDPSISFITAANTAIDFEYGGGFEQLVLTVTTDALVKQLEHILGQAGRLPLDFSGSIDLQKPAGRRLSRLLNYFVRELEAEPTDVPQPLLSEIEDAIITAFIMGYSDGSGETLAQKPVSIAPWQVRRAEDYIVANWKGAITIADLAEHTGVSARSIFKAFKSARGHSPMEFVKSVRLNNARNLLHSATSVTTVTETAFACGFGNLGHFSSDYFRAFGELPSDTLKRAKGR